MFPIRCLLVDDEPPALAVMESHIEMVEGLVIAGKCHNAVEAFNYLQATQVDLLFLDIKMPKLLGTDFVRSLRNPPKVIFTTAYRDYALDGFELDAVDYLLKPVSFERFLRAVNKVMRVDTPATSAPVEMALPAVDNTSTPASNAFLYFRADRKMVKVFVNDIIYIESLKDYVKIITTNAKPLVVRQSISSLEEMLPERLFVRIHRSFVVAVDKVNAFTPSHVDLAGYELPVGRLYQKEVNRLLTGTPE